MTYRLEDMIANHLRRIIEIREEGEGDDSSIRELIEITESFLYALNEEARDNANSS